MQGAGSTELGVTKRYRSARRTAAQPRKFRGDRPSAPGVLPRTSSTCVRIFKDRRTARVAEEKCASHAVRGRKASTRLRTARTIRVFLSQRVARINNYFRPPRGRWGGRKWGLDHGGTTGGRVGRSAHQRRKRLESSVFDISCIVLLDWSPFVRLQHESKHDNGPPHINHGDWLDPDRVGDYVASRNVQNAAESASPGDRRRESGADSDSNARFRSLARQSTLCAVIFRLAAARTGRGI